MHFDVPLDHDDERTFLSLMVDDGPGPDEVVEEADTASDAESVVEQLLGALSEQERDVIMRRWMADDPETLEEVGLSHGVSRERIRQLETISFDKFRVLLKKVDVYAREDLEEINEYDLAEVVAEDELLPPVDPSTPLPDDLRAAIITVLREAGGKLPLSEIVARIKARGRAVGYHAACLTARSMLETSAGGLRQPKRGWYELPRRDGRSD